LTAGKSFEEFMSDPLSALTALRANTNRQLNFKEVHSLLARQKF
jgi:hypothetical protein